MKKKTTDKPERDTTPLVVTPTTARTRRVIKWCDGKWWGVEVSPIDGSYYPLTFGHDTPEEAAAVLTANLSDPSVAGSTLRASIFKTAETQPAKGSIIVLAPESIVPRAPAVAKPPHPLVQDLARTPALMVYGTLRAEERASAFMMEDSGGVPFASVTLTGYDLFGFGIPGIRPSTREGAMVVGEVYRLSDPRKLERLDEYEGAYTRTLVRPKVTGPLLDSIIPRGLVGTEIDAWVYVYHRDYGDLIPGGDWVKHVKANGHWRGRIRNF